MTQDDERLATRRASGARTLEAYRASEKSLGKLSATAARATAGRTVASTCGQCGDVVTFQYNGATYAIDEDGFPLRLPMSLGELESVYERMQDYKAAQRDEQNGVTPSPGIST